VRAPFTAVDVPPRGYYYYEPAYPPPVVVERRVVEPAFPSATEFAAMDAAQLEQALRSISQSLQNQLDRFNTGESWQRYLRIPESLDASRPPNERSDAIAKLLDRFDKIAGDPQYSMIARLSAFQAMQAALTEALSRPQTDSTPEDGAVEDLPLPVPENPNRRERKEPFLRPLPPQ
jgi:hypothetical protein